MTLYPELAEISAELGLDEDNLDEQLIDLQLENDERWIQELVAIRKRDFPDVDAFAASIGLDGPSVLRFEGYPHGHSLEFVRLYNLGIGAVTVHHPTQPRTEMERALALTEFRLRQRQSHENITHIFNWNEHKRNPQRVLRSERLKGLTRATG